MPDMPTIEEDEHYDKITYGDDALTDTNNKYLEEWYAINNDKKNITNILDEDEIKAYEYYCTIHELCLNHSMNFLNTIIKLMKIEVQDRVESNQIEMQYLKEFIGNFNEEIMNGFTKSVGGKGYKEALIGGKVNLKILTVIKNSFLVAERILSSKELIIKKTLYDNAFVYMSENSKETKLRIIESSFENLMSFTRMINNKHGLKPLIDNVDLYYSTIDDKKIHLGLTRGLVFGHVKKSILLSMDKKQTIKNLVTITDSLNKANEENDLDEKLDLVNRIIEFVNFGSEHKKVIEYYDLGKSMNLTEDELRLFARKLFSSAENIGPSARDKIDSLIKYGNHNIDIRELVEFNNSADYDMLFSDRASRQLRQ